MGTNITGWVEINTVNESTEDIWFKVIEIDMLAERDYDVFGKLFGVRADEESNPVASSRGFPKGTPDCCADELKQRTDVVGITWASYEEIAGSLSDLCGSYDLAGWTFISEAMSKLKQRFGRGNVRIVVGFDNHG